LRIASYNIHGCVGTDGKYRPERIRQVLNQLDAQIIALQEVEAGPGYRKVMQQLCTEQGWQYIDGPTLQRNDADYGNAILSSLPVKAVYRLDLSYRNREPRGAIDVRIDNHGSIVRVIATHLGLSPAERRDQVRRLLHWIGPPGQDSALTTVLMGDMNEWFLWGRPVKWLRSYFGTTPSPATFHSFFPVFALDRIWVYPIKRLLNVEAVSTIEARIASDHYPLVATLAEN
jgi:endonuclease/exonuclease/phosphatase family metal-dependent hydrolase